MNHLGLKLYFSASILTSQNGGTIRCHVGVLHGSMVTTSTTNPVKMVLFVWKGCTSYLMSSTQQATCWSLGTWTMTACHDRQNQGGIEHKSKEAPTKNASRAVQDSKIDNFIPKPIGSMYGIFTYIWLIFMVNVGTHTIHGSYGKRKKWLFFTFKRVRGITSPSQGLRSPSQNCQAPCWFH